MTERQARKCSDREEYIVSEAKREDGRCKSSGGDYGR